MKKFIYLIIIISLFSISNTTFACTSSENNNQTTIDSMLLKDDTAIAVYKIVSGGKDALGSLVIGNKNTNMNINFKTDTSACGTRSEDFIVDNYVVVIYKKGQTTIKQVEFSDQFLYFYSSQTDAISKYTKLLKYWDNKLDDKNSDTAVYSSVDYSLKPGMKNDDVLALQTALKTKLNLGEGFKLDGSYGPATISAVKQFQLSKELTDDGIAGVLTQGKLSGVVIGISQEIGSQKNEDNTEQTEQITNGVEYNSVDYSLKPGMKNDDVLALQTALKTKLNLGEGFKLDGSYGPATISAVKQFQLSKELTDDGIAGVLTQGKLSGTDSIITKKDEDDQKDKQTSQDKVNKTNDASDAELKRILIRAKNEIIYYAVGGKDYTDAYELVSGYNNNFLNIYPNSDPLYKSSGGGLYFVYSLKLRNGEYICADNNYQKEIIQKKERPNINTDQVSC